MKFLTFRDLKNNLRKDRLMYAIRIICGVILAITTADWLGVWFAPSTGVITLLTIDQTKKNTLTRIVLRLGSFVYTYTFSWILLDLLKLDATLGFSIAISLVTLMTFLLRWDLTLSVNCVILIQLFLDNKPFTLNLFLNESTRLIIGLLAAIVVNQVFGVKYESKEDKLNNVVAGTIPGEDDDQNSLE